MCSKSSHPLIWESTQGLKDSAEVPLSGLILRMFVLRSMDIYFQPLPDLSTNIPRLNLDKGINQIDKTKSIEREMLFQTFNILQIRVQSSVAMHLVLFCYLKDIWKPKPGTVVHTYSFWYFGEGFLCSRLSLNLWRAGCKTYWQVQEWIGCWSRCIRHLCLSWHFLAVQEVLPTISHSCVFL